MYWQGADVLFELLKIGVGKYRDKEWWAELTLIEFELLPGDYAQNSAGERFFEHRDWRLIPENVVAIYVRQDFEGEVYYYPFDRFATERIGDMDTGVPQVALGRGVIYVFDDKGMMSGEVVSVSVMA